MRRNLTRQNDGAIINVNATRIGSCEPPSLRTSHISVPQKHEDFGAISGLVDHRHRQLQDLNIREFLRVPQRPFGEDQEGNFDLLQY